MTYDEGRALIAQMQKEHKLTNWSIRDLSEYFDEKQGAYLTQHGCEVHIDGVLNIAELEAVLIALYNERGAPKG